MLQMNLITQNELCKEVFGGLYTVLVYRNLNGINSREILREVSWEWYRELSGEWNRELRGELGPQIRTDFSHSKISRV